MTRDEVARQRLCSLLAGLKKKGINQQRFAESLGIASTYLSDLKYGRRPISKLFSYKLAELTGADAHWFQGHPSYRFDEEGWLARPGLAGLAVDTEGPYAEVEDAAEPLAVGDCELAIPNYSYFGFIPCVEDKTRGFPVAVAPDAYDGDTVRMSLDLGCDTWLGLQYFRLYGIQAPEIRPLKTRKAATTSKHALQHFITAGSVHDQPDERWPGPGCWVYVVTHKSHRKRYHRPKAAKGKYGRYLVELFGKSENGLFNINRAMLNGGFAEPYQA